MYETLIGDMDLVVNQISNIQSNVFLLVKELKNTKPTIDNLKKEIKHIASESIEKRIIDFLMCYDSIQDIKSRENDKKIYIGIINSIELEYYGRVGDIIIVEIDENFPTVCTIERPLDRRHWNESGNLRTVGCVVNVPIEYIKIIDTDRIKQLLQYIMN